MSEAQNGKNAAPAERRPFVRQRVPELGDGAWIAEFRNPQLEHENRHRDREDAVEQEFEPASADNRTGRDVIRHRAEILARMSSR
jgi:hypothetical protein